MDLFSIAKEYLLVGIIAVAVFANCYSNWLFLGIQKNITWQKKQLRKIMLYG